MTKKHDPCHCGTHCDCEKGATQERTRRVALQYAVQHAAHFLPAQGPIGVFVHHNTLHAFQHLPFERAVIEAAELFNAEPYLSEQCYQDHRKNGRILDQDVDTILGREPDKEILSGALTRSTLRRALLIPGVRRVNHVNITWQIEEGDFLREFRYDLPPAALRALASDTPNKLWDVCISRYQVVKPMANQSPRRPAEALLISRKIELDEVVNPMLIRLVSSYLDQGLAYWPMPSREKGLLGAARDLFEASTLSDLPKYMKGSRKELQDQAGMDAEDTVLRMLDLLGVPYSEWDDFIMREFLALPGWTGLMKCLEENPSLAPHERLDFSLMDLLALRLTFTKIALHNIDGSSVKWREKDVLPALHFDPLTHQARLFDACQLLGIHSEMLRSFSDVEFQEFCVELEMCHEWERRRLLHLAYELRHERQILIPLARHLEMASTLQRGDRLQAQVVFCIDEREESLRRALEEINPLIETYGAAGFFGCAVDYTGLDDAGGVPLCPVVVRPDHQVSEIAIEDDKDHSTTRQKLRKLWASILLSYGIGTRTLVRGTLSTACLGFLSLFPMALRVFAPLKYSQIMTKLNGFFLPNPRTEMLFMRNDDESRHATTGLLLGFSHAEMADRVANMLNPMGMIKAHARLIIIVGHGSSSLNNPFVSAYCCGACGGRSGAPNARLFALMANKKEVRELLRERGIQLPEDAWFVGSYHDTCSDEMKYFDVDLMPAAHGADFAKFRSQMDDARARSAHERTRRFDSFDNKKSVSAALRHVQERSEHLAEPRPEYGHCTNAVAFVGRRSTTQGLFMDRRSFLISYDASNDAQDKYLASLLGAVIPVCGGINLEYYFCTVDNERYGCGTKLPHNITGLVGVMNGYQGDLRTGLPLQTVEIHEPVRILFVVETTPERLLRVIHASSVLTEFLENRWIRLAVIDPETGKIQIYRGDHHWKDLVGDEEPLPIVASSIDYYQGKSGHLPLARISSLLLQTA